MTKFPRRDSRNHRVTAGTPAVNGEEDITADRGLDILLRVTAAESHGTAPLNWDCQGCRLPSQHTVGIGE